MATATNLKILTVGPAVGAVRELFDKVKAINSKHGKFDLCVCVGDFFGPPAEDGGVSSEVQDLLDGKLEAPLEMYVMQGEHPLPGPVIERFAKTSGDLGKNVFLLSKSATVTTPHGLRIACLGGAHDPRTYATSDVPLGFTSPYFSRQTVDKLLANSSSNSSMSAKAKDYTSLAAITGNAAPTTLVDILLTNVWPASVTQFTAAPNSAAGAAPLDVLVRSLKPRYHITPGVGDPHEFWEREPYVWDDEGGRVSRFVALGAFGGPPPQGKKQRWFYAFSIAPLNSSAPAAPRPANATRNPFVEAAPGQKRQHEVADGGDDYIWGGVKQPGKRPRTEGGPNDKPPPGYQCKICQSPEHFINECPDRQKPPKEYLCKICNGSGHFVRDCPTKHAVGDTGGRKPRDGYNCRACGSELHYLDDCPVAQNTGGRGGRGDRRRGPPKEIQPDECWFCLSNPNIAKHLIVAVGMECYITLPKGQLIPTHGPGAKSDVAKIPGGGHVLIVPIGHVTTLASLGADSSTSKEVEGHKAALRKLYAKHGADAVFLETARVSAKGGHAHVQAVPVPRALAPRVAEAFAAIGQREGVDFAEDTAGALAACADGTRGYFRVDLPDGGLLVHVLRERGPFQLQFGRQVMAEVLGLQDRTDWRACAQSDDDDNVDAAAFKAAFAPFDSSS